MDLRHLNYFLVLAEELHFGRAAERLHISQPPLTRMIKQIENELGVLLFERTKRSVILTTAGVELLQDAKQMVLQMETVKKRLTIHGKGETGTLKIGYVGAVMYSRLPMLLSAFTKNFPHINLQFEEQPNHSLLHGLNNGTLDAVVAFETINYQFFQSFQRFLLDRSKLVNGVPVPSFNNTTIAKQLSTLKTILNYARIHGIEIPDKYRQFKINRESLEVIVLTSQEFEKLYNYNLTNKKLQQVRDIFCFSCGSGLRYSDLAQLKWEHIKDGEIKFTVKKTKESLTVPLNPYTSAILKRYEGQMRPLPMISNQKLNKYLKELCELAGIDEPIEIVRYRGIKREETIYPKYELIGVHTARKTFATLSLEKGMSAEEVMSITGHKNYQAFKRYVKITEQRKKVVMKKAWVIPESKLRVI